MKKKTKTAKKNVTIAKLNDLPFKSAKALKDAQEKIRIQVWRRLEEAKTINEMLKLAEYKFWEEEFVHGLTCSYVDDNEHKLVKVYSEGDGIKISINKSLAGTAPLGETILSQIVRSISESFATTYYKAKGIIPMTESTHKIADFEV
jgi:hypothetical protein